MRIAYVINSLEGGGAASPVPDIARILRDCGAEVRLFALTRRNGRALPAIIEAGLDPLIREGGEWDHLAACRWLDREVMAWGATHIWTSLSRASIFGLLIGPRRGLPVICWQHNAFLRPWNRRLLRILQSRAMLWVGDSHVVSALTAQRLGVPDARLATWPIFSADPAMPQAKPWQPGETLRIGSLGRLHPAKGYDVLIAALARLRADGFAPPCPISVTVAGEGHERERLEAMAREAGLDNITFPGFAEHPRHFLADLHLYVQPSRREGFCIAAHEAMAAALPVIASAVGEMPYTLTDGVSGRIVPPEDVEALAEALREMLRDPAALHNLGQAARLRVLDRFSRANFHAAGAEIVARLRGEQLFRTAR